MNEVNWAPRWKVKIWVVSPDIFLAQGWGKKKFINRGRVLWFWE